jgi:hypothetical protein
MPIRKNTSLKEINHDISIGWIDGMLGKGVFEKDLTGRSRYAIIEHLNSVSIIFSINYI